MAFVLGASVGVAWLFRKITGLNDRMRASDIRSEEVQRDLDENRRQHVEAQRRAVESQRLVESTQRQLGESLRRLDQQNTGDGSYKFLDGIAGIDGVVRNGESVVTLPPCTLVNVEIGPLENVGGKDGFVLYAEPVGFPLGTLTKSRE